MVNLHLLKRDLTVDEYEEASKHRASHKTRHLFFDRLPEYMVARCPYCHKENIEQLDTYSVAHHLWTKGVVGESIGRIVHHCEHFRFIQPFVNFHSIWPSEARGEFDAEVPHVIGHLLEKDLASAVIHALPICRIEDDTFVPRYTGYMVSHFSEISKEAIENVALKFNLEFAGPYIIYLTESRDTSWQDLRSWVETGKLYWVDANTSTLEIRTSDAKNFPYGDIKGKTFPVDWTISNNRKRLGMKQLWEVSD